MSQGDLQSSDASTLEEEVLKRKIQEPEQSKQDKDKNGGNLAVINPQQPDEPQTKSVALPSFPDEVLETLKKLGEDVSQIHELSSEEGSVVNAFFFAFLQLMEPLAKAFPVDVSVLQPFLGSMVRANIVPKGDLIILFHDSRMESVDLSLMENRDLLIAVMIDVMPKFNRLVSQRRNMIEKRINFLSSVTRELQNIAETFSNNV